MGERAKEGLETDLSPYIDVLAQHFIGRWDLYAQQLDDGRYLCIHSPLNNEHLTNHLRGEITLGTYMLDSEDKARFVVLDADDRNGFKRMLYLAELLVEDGVQNYVEKSRRGAHLWFFFDQPITGETARHFGLGVLEKHGFAQVEVFPKQASLGGGPGSLIRLPYGVHKLSNQRYGFFHPDGSPLANTLRDQILVLNQAHKVPSQVVETYASFPIRPERPSFNIDPPGALETVSEKIKAAVPVQDFLRNYIDMTSNSSGAMGLCPFHDDHRPSLGVNDERNYWHCFAGCGGGSIIDFWMKRRGLDFEDAIKELARKLL